MKQNNDLVNFFRYHEDPDVVADLLGRFQDLKFPDLEVLVGAVVDERLHIEANRVKATELIDLSTQYWNQSIHRAQNLVQGLRLIQNIQLGRKPVATTYIVYGVCPRDNIVSEIHQPFSEISDRLSVVPEELISHLNASDCSKCGTKTHPTASMIVIEPVSFTKNPFGIERIVGREKGISSTAKRLGRLQFESGEYPVRDLDAARLIYLNTEALVNAMGVIPNKLKEKFVPYSETNKWKGYEGGKVKRFPGHKAWFRIAGMPIELQVLDVERNKKDRQERPDIFGDPVSKMRVVDKHYLGRKMRQAIARLPEYESYVEVYEDLLTIGLIRHLQASGNATLLADTPHLLDKHAIMKRKY